MTLNTIELPEIVIAQLYPNSLFAAGKIHRPKTHPVYKFLGNNGRKITLVVHSEGIPYLQEDQLDLLTRMLEACNLNLGDVALVNHATMPVVIDTLKTQLQPAILVLFGVEPASIMLPFTYPEFHIQAFDHCEYLYVPSLEELVPMTDQGKLLRTKLWFCLRQLFGIKPSSNSLPGK